MLLRMRLRPGADTTHLKTSQRVHVFHCALYAKRANKTFFPCASFPSDDVFTAFSLNRRVAFVWAS
jgi:hypothetical protein